MKKKILAMLLAVVMAVGLLPGTVLPAEAAETPVLTGGEMVALLPSERPEVIVPETLDQTSDFGGNGAAAASLIGDEATETAYQEIIALTQRLTSGAKTETEKARAIFDWVATNIAYDYVAYGYIKAADPDGDGVISVGSMPEEQYERISKSQLGITTYYYRSGVCNGYTHLANFMLALAGLPAAYVKGKEANEYHAWSAVYADGQWILFDATWNGWDIAPDYHTTTEEIRWPDGIFRLELSWTGQIAFGIMSGYDCPAHVTVPDSATAIGNAAFANRTNLTGVTIPDSVTAIGNGAFAGCTGLTSFDIPDSVTSIGGSTFWGCTGLTSITIPDSVTSIGDSAFGSCSNLTSITIPDSVTSIGIWAFDGCTSLTSITIPDGVPSIGQYTFAGCTSLTSINIPDSVTEIGASAFKNCSSLTSVTIPGSVTSIGHGAFEACTALTDVTILGGVTGIEGSGFDGCSSLARVSIPASMTSIASAAFWNCDSLTVVYYSGSEEQWNAIEIASFNSPLSRGNPKRATIHYNSTGPEPTEPEPEAPKFNDVPENAWYIEEVSAAVERGLIEGVGNGNFNPNGTLTRAEAVTILGRLAGEDVKGGSPWYQKAMDWAKGRGITDGTNPGNSITREQLAVMLWRYADEPGADASALDKFSDSSSVNSWAREAMAWAVANGIVTGSGGKLNPQDTANRAQAVTMVMRYVDPDTFAK